MLLVTRDEPFMLLVTVMGDALFPLVYVFYEVKQFPLQVTASIWEQA